MKNSVILHLWKLWYNYLDKLFIEAVIFSEVTAFLMLITKCKLNSERRKMLVNMADFKIDDTDMTVKKVFAFIYRNALWNKWRGFSKESGSISWMWLMLWKIIATTDCFYTKLQKWLIISSISIRVCAMTSKGALGSSLFFIIYF